MHGGDGLSGVDPVGMKRPMGAPAAVDKAFRAFDPHQVLLLLLLLPPPLLPPLLPSLDDWLPEDHLARFVADLVDEVLDLGPIRADYVARY
jgi:hypothetical protein